MGERGREWMEQEFEWSTVARATIDLYRWLEGSADRPSHVVG